MTEKLIDLVGNLATSLITASLILPIVMSLDNLHVARLPYYTTFMLSNGLIVVEQCSQSLMF